MLFQTRIAGAKALERFDDQHPIVFCLSTGRAGTQTLSAVLKLAANVITHHEPCPILFQLSKRAYQQEGQDDVRLVLKQAFLIAREDLLRHSLRCGRGYIETSPQATFLAPIILEAIPQAKFIHVVRDPRAVIRSGMRRKWYDGHVADESRIVPLSGTVAYSEWDHYSSFQRNIWLWAETNRWISDFTLSIPQDKTMRVAAEDIFAGPSAVSDALFRFVGSTPPSSEKVLRVLRKRLNAQQAGQFPVPDQWTNEMHEQVQHIAGDVITRLGYRL